MANQCQLSTPWARPCFNLDCSSNRPVKSGPGFAWDDVITALPHPAWDVTGQALEHLDALVDLSAPAEVTRPAVWKLNTSVDEQTSVDSAEPMSVIVRSRGVAQLHSCTVAHRLHGGLMPSAPYTRGAKRWGLDEGGPRR